MVPRPSTSIGRLGENRDWTAACRYFFQMAVGEESHEFSVGGPERKRSAVRTIELPGRQVAEGLDPDEIAILLAAGAKRDRRPIGGGYQGARKTAGRTEACPPPRG